MNKKLAARFSLLLAVTGQAVFSYPVFTQSRSASKLFLTASGENGATTRISVSSTGEQGNARSDGSGLVISADNRFVAFNTLATNLADGPSPVIFDRTTSQAANLPKGFDGQYLPGANIESFSNDGRYILFEATATNIVPPLAGEPAFGGWSQVYLFDGQGSGNGSYKLISKDVNGFPAYGGSSGKLSGNGRYVVYGENYYRYPTLKLRDLSTDQVTVVVETSTTLAGGAFSELSISDDGRFVAFQGSTELLPGGRDPLSSNGGDIYLYDRVIGTIKRISAAQSGTIPNDSSWSPHISRDGSVVVFWSQASNLMPCNTTCAQSGLYVYTISTGQIENPLPSAGVDGNQISLLGLQSATISANGRLIAFISSAANLVVGDQNSITNVFIVDRLTKAIQIASVSTTGSQTFLTSVNPVISADGSMVAFGSEATNLVDNDTNGVWDVFVHQLCAGTSCIQPPTPTPSPTAVPTATPNPTTTKYPIIFLPGTGASFNALCYMKLPGESPACFDERLWGWMPDPTNKQTAEAYNRLFLDKIASSKYAAANSSYFSIFHYDWRQTLNGNIPRLKTYIDKIKALTQSSKVVLVGHSQGGLLARAYIQDDSYQFDVSKLITVGTPHLGMPRAYPFWEGGAFYRMSKLERAATIALVCQKCLNDAAVLQKKLPIFRDLLPTYDYIEDGSDFFKIKPERTLVNHNLKLLAMNSASAIEELVKRTSVVSIVGRNVSTPVRMVVVNRTPKQLSKQPLQWVDGEALSLDTIPLQSPADGDGTIPLASSQFVSSTTVYMVDGVQHGSMMDDPTVVRKIFTELSIPWIGVTSSTATATEVGDGASMLTLDGRATLTVTDKLGGVVSPVTNTIQGAEYFSSPDGDKTWVLLPSYEGILITIGQTPKASDISLSLYRNIPQLTSVITNEHELWDISKTIIDTSGPLEYSVSTSPQSATELIAVRPIIELPLDFSGLVTGRSLPGTVITIVDAVANNPLGSGVTDSDGRFSIRASRLLRLGDKVYPTSNGSRGADASPEPISTYLPVATK